MMTKKETATPAQKLDDKSSYYFSDTGHSIRAVDQAAAEAKYREITGEEPQKKETNTPKK